MGQFGRLHFEGLQGDVWRDFKLRRMTLTDANGVWLEAKNIRITWHYLGLLKRRIQADEITADQLRILRRPVLSPKRPERAGPVSIHLADVRTQVETLPAFSAVRGLYVARGRFDIARSGRQAGAVSVISQLRAGDRLVFDFVLGKAQPMRIDVVADEAQGGAIAGSLGLPADQRFVLRVHAAGQTSRGQFTAVADSGAKRPLDASGQWRPGGGQARGRIQLSASRLMTDLATRIGPQVDFDIVGKRAGKLYNLDARLVAANLAGTVRGRGDIGQRRAGPEGLAVVLTAADFSKVSGAPARGPARLAGVWRGDAATWAFRGSGEVADPALGGYGLTRVSGPVEITHKARAYGFTADLRGAGGTGRGWFAALLGAAPSARIEGSRLADGRVLLRRVDVDGVGLKVRGGGDRGLLGGLNFQGDAVLSNLAAARPGASGTASAKWSATQGGSGRPWVFTLDAKAARFASGLAELDRLLGPQPALKAAASLDKGVVAISRADLAGAMTKVAATGTIGPEGGLGLKLNWTANGPFRAGPVEITGAARGTGAVTGVVTAPRAELIADFDAIDLPRVPLRNAHVTLVFTQQRDGSTGMATLLADSAYGPARARSDFRFPQGGLDLSDLAVDAAGVNASGSLSLRQRAPSAADLKLRIGRGAFLDGGAVTGWIRIVDAGGGARADLDLKAENAVFRGARLAVRSGRLNAEGPMARLPYRLKLDGAARGGAWGLDGSGTFAESGPGYSMTFQGAGEARGRRLATVEPAVLRFGGGIDGVHLPLAAADGGRVELDGTLSDGLADIQGQVSGLALATLDQDLAGKFDATLSVKGRGGDLAGTLDARLQGARGRGADAATGLDATLKARLAGDTVTLEANATNAQGLRADANLTLPAESSTAPFRIAINRTKPMRGRFFAEGEVKPLWDLLVGGERNLSGQVRTEGTLGGTLADPQAQGQAEVRGGRFEDGASGLVLTDAAAAATFANTAIDVSRMSGSDGRGGSLSGSGRINLARNGVSSFRLDLSGFRLIDNDQATASASGQAAIDRGADGKVRISGALTIDRAEVAAQTRTPSGVVVMEVVERNRPADLKTTLAAPPRTVGDVALDVTLKAPRRVFLRGRGLDIEMSLDARVSGSTARPRLTGVARVVRGDYEFAGKRFEFDPRGVVYLSMRLEDIRLDLAAAREDPALTAVVQIRGTAAKPEVTLTSTPVLPNDEVLSQVLFGRSASQLSPLEAAQLASALSALAGGGGFDVIGNLRSFARLDRLALGGGDANGVTISGGKYLTDDVYLEVTGGGREGPSAQVEWRVSRNLSILSRLGGQNPRLGSQNDARLAVRWRKDY